MSLSYFEIALALVALGALALVASRKPPAPGAEEAARVSGTCKTAFFFAFLALLTSLAAALTAEGTLYRDLLRLSDGDVKETRMIAEILRLCALAPGLAALAFAIAGRGAVRESGGALRGKALYRMSALVALGVVAAAWAGLSVSGFTAARPGGP